jgi:hypothetical protein
MKLLKQTIEYRTDSEPEAKALIEKLKENAETEGFILSAAGYVYKTKKAKGEIIDEAYVVKVVQQFGGVWDDE